MVIESHPKSIEVNEKILFGIDLDNIKDVQFLNILQIHVDSEVDICSIELLLFFEMIFYAAFLFELLEVGLLGFHLFVERFLFLQEYIGNFLLSNLCSNWSIGCLKV
jgi:hypothetical protein